MVCSFRAQFPIVQYCRQILATTDLRVNSFASISRGQTQKAWGKENQHFLGLSYLILCPPRRALGTKFAGHHSIHDDVIAIFSEVVHNGSHFAAKSFVFRVIAAVVNF